MNVTFATAILAKDSGLTPTQRLLALAIARHEPCTASYSVLAAETGLARRSVIRAAQDLQKTGWVKRGKKGWELRVKGDTESPAASVRVSPVTQSHQQKKTAGRRVQRYGSVTPELIEWLVGKYKDRLGEEQVRLEIEKALNHKASEKWLSKRLGLQTWLNNAVKWQEERNAASRNGNQRSSQAVGGTGADAQRRYLP